MSLIIRADADINVGTGHFMRGIALGQAWQRDGDDVHFVTACQNPQLLQRARDEGFITHSLNQRMGHDSEWHIINSLIAAPLKSWIVLDGYHFAPEYHLRATQCGFRLAVIDDMAHLPHYYADLVLNQNIYSEEFCYSLEQPRSCSLAHAMPCSAGNSAATSGGAETWHRWRGDFW